MKASLILLAGGHGQRLGSPTPKQYISIENKLVIEYALAPFLHSDYIESIVIVCEEKYQPLFSKYLPEHQIAFALPGKRRQESLENGLYQLKGDNPLVIVHDAARPFIDSKYIEPLLTATVKHGAAILAVPATSTLKEVDEDQMVLKTLNRSKIWEVQTPQASYKKTFLEGIAKVKCEKIEATDDASLVELIDKPVKVVLGDRLNFKITTIADLRLMQCLLQQQDSDYVQILHENRL